MSGALLRSGALREFFALGAVGHPVYQSAPQLRVAMRNQIGADVADTFAVPKRNDSGDTIDWYAPIDGPVVPWTSATEEERAAALESLQAMRERVLNAGRRLEAEADSERQVFGRLLQHVMTIPDDQHVYLVDGKPVLAFWGFHRHDGATFTDSLAMLARTVAPVETDVKTPVPVDPPVGRRWPWWMWLLLLLLLIPLLLWFRSCSQVEVLEVDPPVDELADFTQQHTEEVVQQPVDVERRPVDLVPGTEKVVTQNQGTLPADRVAEELLDPTAVEEELLQDAQEIVPPELPESALEEELQDVQETVPPELLESALEEPLQDPESELPEPAPEEQPQDLESEPPELGPEEQLQDPEPESPVPEEMLEDMQAEPPVPPNSEMPQGVEPPPLTIPPEALEQGNVDFLNGRWSSNSGLIDHETGRPVRLDYDFKDGKGEVSLRRSDGTECRGQAGANISQQRLVIADRNQLRCPDGQIFKPPTVDCAVGTSGRAECKGRYESGSAFPVEIHQAEQRGGSNDAR